MKILLIRHRKQYIGRCKLYNQVHLLEKLPISRELHVQISVCVRMCACERILYHEATDFERIFRIISG